MNINQKMAFYTSYGYFPVCEEKNKKEIKKHHQDNVLKFLAYIPIISTIAYIVLAIKEKVFKQHPTDEFNKAKLLDFKIRFSFSVACLGWLLLPADIFATGKLLHMISQEKKHRVISATKI